MNPHWVASPEEIEAFNRSMAGNPLWRMIDCTPAPDDDDDFETHARRERLTKEELI